MAINKVVYGSQTLIDLTADTVTPELLALGVTAHDKAGEPITGTSTKDVDSTDATASEAEILSGKTRATMRSQWAFMTAAAAYRSMRTSRRS